MNFFFQLSYSFADEVIIGNDVLVQENGELVPEKVTEVSSVTMQGMCIVLFFVKKIWKICLKIVFRSTLYFKH